MFFLEVFRKFLPFDTWCQLSCSSIVFIVKRFSNDILYWIRQYLRKHKSRLKVTRCPADLVTFTGEILNGKLHFFQQLL